jgi:hypothetical protein
MPQRLQQHPTGVSESVSYVDDKNAGYEMDQMASPTSQKDRLVGSGSKSDDLEPQFTRQSGEVLDGAGHAIGGGDDGDRAGAAVAYKVYKRRWFGLVSLTFLNIIVSWDVSIPGLFFLFAPVSASAALRTGATFALTCKGGDTRAVVVGDAGPIALSPKR